MHVGRCKKTVWQRSACAGGMLCDSSVMLSESKDVETHKRPPEFTGEGLKDFRAVKQYSFILDGGHILRICQNP